MSIPQAVIWEITRQCNFNCKHCIVDAAANKPDDELTTGQAKEFIDNYAIIGGKHLFFSGGEPLLRKDLEEIIVYASGRGFSGFSIASNGSLVKEERIISLKSSGVTNMQFSIDGATAEKNACIRSGNTDSFAKVINAVRIARKYGLTVSIGTFLCPDNIGDIPEIIEICKNEKVNMLRFSGFIPLGRGSNDSVISSMKFTIEQMIDFFKFIKALNPDKSGVNLGFDHAFGPFIDEHCCNAGNEIFYLASNGDIYPCPSFLHESFRAGNVKEGNHENLLKLLKSEKMTKCQVEKADITGSCSECPDIEWCNGGCRGTAFAYNGDLTSSFGNCLRDFRRKLAVIYPEIMPDKKTERTTAYSKLYGDDISFSLKPEDKSSFINFNEYERTVSSAAYTVYPDNAPPYPVFNPLANLEEFYKAHASMLKSQIKEHTLNYLLWESTLNCNFNCIHCSSPKEQWINNKEMTTKQVKDVFARFASEFDVSQIQALGITGGEPLLRKDIFEIAAFLTRLGFKTAIDTNGFLTGKRPGLLSKLEDAGIDNICVSFDGMREQFAAFRGVDGFNEAVNTIKCIVNKHPQIFVQTITMVTKFNIDIIDQIFDYLENLGVKYARFGTVMSVGRASEDDMNFLDSAQLVHLMKWITTKRRDFLNGKTGLQIEFTDNGWCGRVYEPYGFEGSVRQGCFMCTAGINMGIITYDGKFGGCLSVEPNLNIQGDLLVESPRKIWESRFNVFRDKDKLKTGKCIDCSEWDFCMGGGMHERDKSLVSAGCTFCRINRTNP